MSCAALSALASREIGLELAQAGVVRLCAQSLLDEIGAGRIVAALAHPARGLFGERGDLREALRGDAVARIATQHFAEQIDRVVAVGKREVATVAALQPLLQEAAGARENFRR